jgi:hypothetical protein
MNGQFCFSTNESSVCPFENIGNHRMIVLAVS